MKRTISFTGPSRIDPWEQVLVANRWKLVRSEEDRLRARKEVGESELMNRLTVTWFVEVSAVEDGVTVEITVPAYASSFYARARIQETLSEWATQIGTPEYKPETDLSVDAFEHLPPTDGYKSK